MTGLEDVTTSRLEDQIGWYDGKSRENQLKYKVLKGLEIVAAALVTGLAGLNSPRYLIVGLGIVVVAVEGVLQLNQYHASWISYRSTCEALKHEKFLYLANAGPYSSNGARHGLLAERIESLVSQEHAKWASTREQEQKPTNS